MTSWALGIDIGGTFTDIVALDYSSGQQHGLKVLTTHVDPALGVASGVKELLALHKISPRTVTRVVHATTLFTNALIERKGARTGLIVTQGFKDIIEIGHERKYELYDLQIESAPPLIERKLRAEISARMNTFGHPLAPVDHHEVHAAARSLVAQGVESIAVCLLHAYASSAHECEVRDQLLKDFAHIDVTISSDVAPVIREFERISTTAANAYIKPLASRYLQALTERLNAMDISTSVLMMLSNGGLSHLSEAKRTPIELLESGPAAGAISAAYFSLRDDQANLLAFDMGGTTAKLCLVENSRPSIAYGFEAARRKRFAEGSGLPVRITTIDLLEIGAGGGSIAYQDQLGLLKVGPQSAGSEPGPACYGLGGTAPTVTDANLLLGYLSPRYFAGGALTIYEDLARASLLGLSKQLGRDLTAVAWGIHDIVAENMAGAARVHVAERGRDPRHFILLCTGGGGPLHAYYVAQKIGVKQILCPPSAGVASAYGLLVAPARADRSRTLTIRLATEAISEIEQAFKELEVQASVPLELLSDAFGPITLTRLADGRYAGQGFNLTVELPAGPYAGDTPEEQLAIRTRLIHAFENAYRAKFGRTPPDVPVELMNLRVTAQAMPLQRSTSTALAEGQIPKPKEFRSVYFHEARDYIDTPVFERSELRTGFSMFGPLLIEDASSTLVVGPKGRVAQSETGNILITIEDSAMTAELNPTPLSSEQGRLS